MNKTKKLPLVKASTSELKEAAQLEETCGVQLSCGPCLNKRCKISFFLIFLDSSLLLTQKFDFCLFFMVCSL